MLRSLESYIRKHSLFRPGDRVGVAVSSGADSVALLRALLDLRHELGIVLGVVHVHHGIRGAEADGDQHFVESLARHHNLPLSLQRVDVPAHRRRQKLSLETSARELRYQFFRSLLEAGSFDRIATAHTLDDQAETVLLRVLRGTGTRGLAAIPPFRDASPALAARIVRPLLGIRRVEIEEYLQGLHQPWREDASNRDTRHLRNRIRHDLLPLLEGEYNPAVRHGLVNLAEIARAEEEHWTAETERLKTQVIRETEGTITLERPAVLAVPLALRRRLFLAIADDLDLPAGFDDIELMLHIAENPGSQHVFEGGWTVSSSKPAITFQQKPAMIPAASYELDLEVPAGLALPNGHRLTSSVLDAEQAAHLAARNLLARDRLQLPLRVRSWRAGDRFWPAGSKQKEKLKRLFQEHHVPADQRASWPVVQHGDEIIWVRGFPVAHGYEWSDGEAVLIEVQ